MHLQAEQAEKEKQRRKSKKQRPGQKLSDDDTDELPEQEGEESDYDENNVSSKLIQ